LSIRNAVDRYLRHHDVQVNVVLAFDNIENIKRAVETPFGISILPQPSLAQEVRAGTLASVLIEGHDSDDRLVRPLAIIHRRNVNLERPATKFLELLMSEFDSSSRARPGEQN